MFSENQTRKGGRDTENISRLKKNPAKALRKELEIYREKGVSLYLNGEPSTPKKIAKACQIAEDGVYMRDYTDRHERESGAPERKSSPELIHTMWGTEIINKV